MQATYVIFKFFSSQIVFFLKKKGKINFHDIFIMSVYPKYYHFSM